MNRRELLKRGFELGSAGLLLPMVEPIRRYWSLDRTMVPLNKLVFDRYGFTPEENVIDVIETGWFDTKFPTRWETSGYYVRALIGGQEVLLPMEETSDNNWKMVASEPMTVIGLQYTKSPVYAAN